MATGIRGAVFPVSVMLDSEEIDSYSGDEIVRGIADVGVGLVVAAGAGEGEVFVLSLMVPSEPESGFLRVLFAVQMPKVMTSPSAKPINTAKNTSFFICKSSRRLIDVSNLVKTIDLVYVVTVWK